MSDSAPIPPKGQTAVEIEVTRAPHGVDVLVRLRSLRLAAKIQAEPRSAMLFAWRALGDELEHRRVNLYAALSEGLTRRGEEELGDG